MEEQRKCAIVFATTILAARKLSDPDIKPWGIHVAITDAIDKAKLILEKIDERGIAPSRRETFDDPRGGGSAAFEHKNGTGIRKTRRNQGENHRKTLEI